MLFRFTKYSTAKRWHFVDPDTKFVYEASSKQSLCARVRSYRAQNRLPEIEFLEAVVENYLCRLPENSGACEKCPPFKRGIVQFLRGGVSLLMNTVYPSCAAQEVADKRAAVCVKCPLNVFPDRGPFIKWADDVAGLQTAGKRSAYHDQLGNCGGCSCLLRSKVFFDKKISLLKSEKQKMQEANSECWQVKESEDG